MQKTKVSLICKYKGIFHGKKILQGVFFIGNNGAQKDDSNHEYLIGDSGKYNPSFLISGSTYSIDGYLYLSNDYKMSIEIITADEVINPATGKSPF